MSRSRRKRQTQPHLIKNSFAGQLGVPTSERAAKSTEGFETEVVSAGAIPIVRSRQKYFITPPEVQRAWLEEELMTRRLRGIECSPESIHLKPTAVDRLLTSVEHSAICWYFRTHTKIKAPHIRIGDYGQRDDPKQPDSDSRPLTKKEASIYYGLQNRLPPSYLVWLDQAAWVLTPPMREGEIPDLIAIAKARIDSQDARKAEGGMHGYIAAVAECLLSSMHDEDVLWERKERARCELYSGHIRTQPLLSRDEYA